MVTASASETAIPMTGVGNMPELAVVAAEAMVEAFASAGGLGVGEFWKLQALSPI